MKHDCPHPAFLSLTNIQTYRLYGQIYRRMTRGDGYQPFGYDWPTIRLTKPGFYAALKLMMAGHNWCLKHNRVLPSEEACLAEARGWKQD